MSLLLYHENNTPPAPHLARARGGVHPPNKPTPAVDEGTWIH